MAGTDSEPDARIQMIMIVDLTFWLCLATGTGATLAAGAAIGLVGREQRRTLRQRILEGAFQARTSELDRERNRERARSAILEPLVENQPLGGVLDSIAADFWREVPGSLCCVLLRLHDTWRLVAAPGVPTDWAAALRIAFSRKDEGLLDAGKPRVDWNSFRATLSGTPPLAIHTRTIGNSDAQVGMLLTFELKPPASPSEADQLHSPEASLQAAAQLACIAIEHWRFCEDLRHQAHHDSLTLKTAVDLGGHPQALESIEVATAAHFTNLVTTAAPVTACGHKTWAEAESSTAVFRLTGLPNRSLLEERLALSIQEAAAARQMLAVLSIDVDRFKRLNDTLGHRSADIVLTEIASRIWKTLRAGDLVARMGGDEFMVIIGNLLKTSEVDEVSSRILEAIRRPMLVEGKAISPTVSLDSALFPADAAESDSLRRKADGAMRCAKSLGRNCMQSFGLRLDLLDRDRLEEEVREALEFQRLTVHYQPKIGAAGCFCGLEALVRLSSVTHGPLSPASFIPVAEESGLIHQLGAWVLAEVCAQMVDWHCRGLGWVAVAVNVSHAQIARPGFALEVHNCLEKFNVPPTSIELELTESIVLGGGEEGEAQMRDLRSCGIRFSIDDFGTGYSSLSYLYRLPVDASKLDRSFVQAMIGVAPDLGLDVIAEGVETEGQRLALIAAGCPVMQGYFFARPAPEPQSGLLTETTDPLRPPSASDDLLRLGQAVAFSEFQAV